MPGVVTDGDTWADCAGCGQHASIPSGLHYVQLDLGQTYWVDKVKVWHYALDGRTYNATKTQVSEDGTNWVTVFDSAVSGTYAETAAGRTTTFTTQKVRYVRDYTNGNSVNAYDSWVEIEVWGTRTTAYVGNYYEWASDAVAGGIARKYYYAGAQRVAMRQGTGSINFLLGDHLGSTSKTADASGALLGQVLYYPFGDTRVVNGSTATTFRYTGQRQQSEIGLYFYGARWYDSVIGRFAAPDTIVPGAGAPQTYNRYAYTLNNPMRFADSTGHSVDCAVGETNCDAGSVVDPHQEWDLTSYLVSVLRARLRDHRLKAMKTQLAGGAPSTTRGGSDSSAAGNRLSGYFMLFGVESTGAEWDIKQKLNEQRHGVVLCGSTCDYYDPSTLGNIQFGYVAGIAGINKGVGDAAGGILNQIDRLTNGEGVEFGLPPRDDPADQAAVDFGYYLAEHYPGGMTRQQLEHELAISPLTSQFQRPPSDFVPTGPASPGRYRYGPYRYDNQ